MEKKRRNDYIGIKTTSLCRCRVEDFNLYLHYQNIDQGRGFLALDQSESKAKRSVTSTKDDKMHTGSWFLPPPQSNFYQQKFSVQFRDTVRAFKVPRLCCPMQVQHLHPMAASLEEFRNFPFLDNDNIIANLARELPDYLAAADGVVMEDEEEKLAWWAANSVRLPHWASLLKKLLLIQPSSASAERVFSLLNNAFNDQQDNALEDYLEALVMIRYNDAKRH